ncbi:TPA: hypothetical protein EYN98_04335 [Candidatus Poribacteria bacterium]|nr:hypothetical protein [Candidatus Poribacteria bacterium]HIB92125.1 hypothetical protein [Candidatus Poribacteria bacterium]HIC03282.1 hypothetical protein [Candidatus Poribacteria bacterium]HIP09985.1 hypothetical protein [Rhodospirillales bacterium]
MPLIWSIKNETIWIRCRQNRLAFTMSNLTSQTQNIEASRSSIQDADLANHQILSQSATAMFAQTSAISQNILSFLR